ncbi:MULTISPECIES: hypothetical protein [unclassified Pseudomonas]|uniref:hypothetical protein n=1 Tax=unclassified Pseudomonas TaxID=196821 RepID=UPI002447A24A|nr:MULTISPECIES: hypothetical protein [unclassified Pseudomonas]MDH0895930.1 hypothetical protein [Pseudomonas sp. GD03875]MDH1067163.1 hypothetical protein [Pseudomonas sp. GD03985]
MHTTAVRAPHAPQEDELSLGELALRVLRFYRRFGRLLLLPALLAALAAAVWIAGRPLYTATALVEVPGVTLEEWRQAQSFLWDERWVDRSFGDGGDAVDIDTRILRQNALNASFWSSTVRYRSALSRDDIREIPPAEFQNTRGIGLELTLRVRDAQQSNLTLDRLAQHIREALLANSLISLVRDGQAALAHRPKLSLDLLQTDFEIEQAQQRIEDMQRLLERYPELRRMENNTVVSVSDGGGKYLAPLPQIVALEATISELRAKSRKTRRELEKLNWTAQLLAGLDQTIRGAASGDDIIGKLQDNRAKLLAAHPQPSAMEQEATEDMNLKLALAEARQQAIGIKTRSALSSTPVKVRSPFWVGLFVFCATFAGLSLILATRLALRPEYRPVGWLPAPLRRRLILEEPT